MNTSTIWKLKALLGHNLNWTLYFNEYGTFDPLYKIMSRDFRGDITKKMTKGEGDFSPSSLDYNVQQVPCEWSSTVHKVFFCKMDIVLLWPTRAYVLIARQYQIACMLYWK